jgi:hypothetical protein
MVTTRSAFGPPTPSRQALRRFLGARRPCSIKEAAELVGFDEAWVQRQVFQEGVRLDAGRVPWADVALWFMRAWPPCAIDEMTEGIEAWPDLLRSSQVAWRLPVYLLLALERQAARERSRGDRHGLPLEQYVAEQLHLLIEAETVAEFGEDVRFIAAYEFAEEELP